MLARSGGTIKLDAHSNRLTACRRAPLHQVLVGGVDANQRACYRVYKLARVLVCIAILALILVAALVKAAVVACDMGDMAGDDTPALLISSGRRFSTRQFAVARVDADAANQEPLSSLCIHLEAGEQIRA